MVRLVLIALWLCACSSNGGRTLAQQGEGVELVLDGTRLGVIPLARFEARTKLTELLPAEARNVTSWDSFTAWDTQGVRYLHLAKPGRSYAEHDVVLYLYDGKRPAVGFFRGHEARPGVNLVDVAKIHVDREGETAAPKSVGASLVLLTPEQKEIALPFEAIDDLPTREPPNKKARAGGWVLREVLALRLSLATVGQVRLVGREGEAVELSARELEDPKTLLLLRTNRRGLFHFARWDMAPDAREPLDELRDVVRIETRAR